MFVEAENYFEGFLTIQADIIVDGHEHLPRNCAARIVRLPGSGSVLIPEDVLFPNGVVPSTAVLPAERGFSQT